MKLIKNIFLLILIINLLLIVNISYWNSWEIQNKKTISESQNYINKLKEKEVELKNKWDLFTKENWKITSFIIDSLSKKDIEKLENILKKYYKERDIINKKIKDSNDDEEIKKLKKQGLKIKINLYKEIVPYIDKTKIQSYLEYIKSNIDIYEKDKNIKSKIKSEEIKLKKKVINIKYKIIEHRKELNDNLKKIIIERLNQKINNIKENPKFQKLSKEKKIELFKLMLKRLSEKKDVLDNLDKQTTIIKKKIEIYEIAIEIIEKLILTL